LPSPTGAMPSTEKHYLCALIMAVYQNMEQLPAFQKAAITIGIFDGVHAGHRAILREVAAHARDSGGESVLLTFEPHPRKVLFPDQPLGIITPLKKKLELITDTGIQHIVVVPFTAAFAALSASEYVEEFLVKVFNPTSIVIGYDHHFGHDRTGDINLLREYAPRFGFELVEIAAQLIDQAAVSSTKIRNALLAGHIDEANAMLGRNYSFEGVVVPGKQLGRTLGYPTANLLPVETGQVIPGIGVYVVRVQHDGEIYGGMMSIGYNPTVTDTHDIKAEVNIFDFDKDIYDQTIEVFFVAKIRDEQKFGSLADLVAQLHADKVTSLVLLK
jgi:riboflavin kinase / FMN adenylyltransferase